MIHKIYKNLNTQISVAYAWSLRAFCAEKKYETSYCHFQNAVTRSRKFLSAAKKQPTK